MQNILALILSVLLLATTASAQTLTDELGLTAQSKPATTYTAEVHSAVYSQLDFSDTREYDNAVRGLMDAPEALELTNAEGNVIWSQAAYSFLDDYETAPDTVNPSLWENTKNNHAYGLFEVCEGIYQVRGYDMANLTVIKGDTGWIVFDCTMSVECAQAAMQLIEKNLGSFPVKAVIISHSHADHFGGILGVMTAEQAADAALPIEEQLASGKIPIIVPEGFAEHAIAENIYTGKAISRRANYQYGVLLVYENARRENADATITCPKNVLLYILGNNQKGLSALPTEGNAELITLLAQSMNQFPVQGHMPFNIVEP